MNWLLPEAIEDVLPEEAAHLERLRRKLLDLFAGRGYALVLPPMLEFTESLLTGTGHDLDLRTLKLVDQLSGRMMGLRADITPQAARIDAHLLNRRGVLRLCYAGSVLHARPTSPTATREPIQIGAEIYGHAGVESDLEILTLLAQSLESAGVRGVRIDLGHVAVFRSIARAAGIGTPLEGELFAALQAKDRPLIAALTRRLAARWREALLLLPELYGGRDVLGLARRRLPALPKLRNALTVLDRLSVRCALPVGIDLAELRGYHYHSGIVFDATCAAGARGSPLLVARGGRYDEVGRAFGRSRPATGFSIELRDLAAVAPRPRARASILAPWRPSDRALAETVRRLRSQGRVVIDELPGHAAERAELGAAERLVKRQGRWRVVPASGR